MLNNYDEIEEISGYPKIPLGKAEDLRNQKFYKLTPLYRTINRGGKTTWVCKCDCGNITTAEIHSLKSNKKKSCGCIMKTEHPIGLNSPRTINLTGQRFGKLIVLSYEKSTNKHNFFNYHFLPLLYET